MIVRILNGGQYEISNDQIEKLNQLDESLSTAVETGDEATFRAGLAQLVSAVRQEGRPMPDDYLGGSDFVLPSEDASIEEVRDLLTEEGLIPGL